MFDIFTVTEFRILIVSICNASSRNEVHIYVEVLQVFKNDLKAW